ncbi:MAG: flagellar basal body-associated FliL family protein [Gemmatimonadaceae bacterium]
MSANAPAPENEGDAEQAAGGSPSKVMLIAFVSVALAIGIGTGAGVVSPIMAKKMGKTIEAHAPADTAAAAEGEHAAKGEGEKGKEGESNVRVLENLVLNPAGSGGSRFLMLTIAIEAGNGVALEALKARDAELRDVILTDLGAKTIEQLSDIGAREALKTELLEQINVRFGKNSAKRLYFSQFVVQ